MKNYKKILAVLSAAIIVISVLLVGVIAFMIKANININKDGTTASDSNDVNGDSSVDISTSDLSDATNVATTAATTEEVTTEAEPEVKRWFTKLDIMQPHMTGHTLKLEKADLTVFEPAEDGSIAVTDEEGNPIDPWELVTLFPEPFSGSYNDVNGIEEINKQQQLSSTYMVLVDVDTGEVIAERDSEKLIYPASMTKVMTVVTAMEYISESDLDTELEMPYEIIAKACAEDYSRVGFLPGDKVTLRDILYGTIVCSGGDAALALANYCCGSEEAFVEKMNENAKLLGLSENTHYTNCVGGYNDDHYSTMQDVAITMSVAIQNPLLRDVLSTRRYTTDAEYAWDENLVVRITEDGVAAEPEEGDLIKGIEISNLFLRRIEEKEAGGTYVCAKTGYVQKSGCCCVSYFEANNGKRYICVTGNSYSSWRTIYDHVGVYRNFVN